MEDSLFERLQKRLRNAGEQNLCSQILNREKQNELQSISSDSDIDDNITLDECVDFIEKRKSREYTQIKRKVTENNRKIVDENTLPLLQDSHIKSIHTNTHKSCDDLIQNMQGDNILIETSKQLPSINPSSDVADDLIFDADVFKPKKLKITAEERRAIKEQKEKEKLERKKKREKEKLDKEFEKERERAVKKAEAMCVRSEKKEECMERMLAVIDPCLVQENGGGDILKDLQDISVQYELKPLPVVCCIGWMRENVEYKVDENNKVEKSTDYAEELHIIHKISAYELATRIEVQKNSITEGEDTLTGLIKLLKASYLDKRITIVVVGINAYHRLAKTKENEQFRKQALGGNIADVKRKKKDLLVPSITKKEVDEHLVKLQITTDIAIRFCEDMSEFSKLVSSFTKAMAEAPFKKAATSSLQFSASLSDKGSFKVSKDGHGISQVWNQQIQQFYGVRNDVSVAITQVYETPLSLLKAYQDLSKADGEKLLQDIEVRRGVGVLQTKRRVGPELSKKMYKLFTTLNGKEPLAK